jgi:hypothetical protein
MARRSAPPAAGGNHKTLNELQRLTDLFADGLTKAQRESDLPSRRKILLEVAPNFGRLCNAMEQAAVEANLGDSEAEMLAFVRERCCADLLALILDLGQWQLSTADLAAQS